MALVLLFYGCVGTNKEQTNTSTLINNTSSLEQHFLYYPAKPASTAVGRTISGQDPFFDATNPEGPVNITVNDCINVNGDFLRAKCLSSAAAYLNDSQLCQRASESYRDYCVAEYAIKTENPQACDQTGTISADCKQMIAIKTNNPDLCVSNSTQKATNCKEAINRMKKIGKNGCGDDVAQTILSGESGNVADGILWLANNTNNSKVLAWWDYGSALDCAGLANIISNKNMNDPNIMEVSHLLVSASESEIAAYMKEKNSRYLMLTSEELFSGAYLGGKYGALDYLACVYENQTTINQYPGESVCENNGLWETVVATDDNCTAAGDSGGRVAYHIAYNNSLAMSKTYLNDYPAFCTQPVANDKKTFCQSIQLERAYCLIQGTKNQQPAILAYNIQNTTEQIPVFLKPIAQVGKTPQFDNGYVFQSYYEKGWQNATSENAFVKTKTRFYNSILYKGIVLGELNGFVRRYISPQKDVAVFELNN